MQPFEGKVAIVTGGASGIGRVLCEELADRGAIVVVTDINEEGTREVASSISGRGGQARAQALDVTDEGGVRRLVAETATAHGHLDYMFNNAGIVIAGDMRDLRTEHWRRMFDVNLWGVIYGTSAAYAIMAEQGHGHIINMASLAGLVPDPTDLVYTTTKHAVVGLSTALRPGAALLGVKVSVVCPSYVESGIYKAAEIVTPLTVPVYEAVMSGVPFKPMDTRQAVHTILAGVARNRAVIVFPAHARILWWLYRLNLRLLEPLGRRMAEGAKQIQAPRH
jgi:NAD(P)-dependent dehydrogenase (short-subunit alcohol dehydrogenase family)